MRNLGVIFILALVGMAAWRASDRFKPIGIPVTITSKVDQAILPESRPQLPIENFPSSPQAEQTPLEDTKITQKDDSNTKPSARVQAPKPESQAKETDSLEFTRLVIPSLKVNANLITKSYSQLSWDLTDLEQDVAILEDIPGQQPENNILLAGHITVYNGSNGPFRYLWKLEPGQLVMLHDDQFIYTYKVREQVLVYPEDVTVLEDAPEPQLTLITCTTWDEETLSYLRRRVIFADLAQVDERENKSQIDPQLSGPSQNSSKLN